MADNIFLDFLPESINYTSTNRGGAPSLPSRTRYTHAEKLKREMETIWNVMKINNDERLAIQKPVKNGTYIEFIGEIGFPLTIKSLENQNEGIKLLNVRKFVEENSDPENEKNNTNQQEIIKATVYVPKGKEHYFLDRINQYQNENTKTDKPRHNDLITTINSIKLAVLESFWTSDLTYIPQGEKLWCELWIDSGKDETYFGSSEHKIRNRVKDIGLESRDETIEFPERTVILVKAGYADLVELISSVEGIAEIRRATELNEFFTELTNKEQIKWAEDLIERLDIDDSNVVVSLLDTGLNNGNILLNTTVPDTNVLSYVGDTGNDINGHGTNMAGVALFGDIKEVLESDVKIKISHSLESMKIFPDGRENEPHLYGYITSDSVSQLYIENPPDRQRIIAMAVSTDSYTNLDGRPSSWSAAIDNNAVGEIDDIHKLYIISAGNIKSPDKLSQYPDSNFIEPIEDPGQSWNAITIGAYTNLDVAGDRDYQMVANKGELSPFSRTSVIFKDTWPIKPEIVAEGGNAIKDGSHAFSDENLSLLTTHNDPTDAVFTHINATSAATAYVSWLAAKIQSTYPKAWPETIRALLIHSAEWTDEMKAQFHEDNGRKSDYRKLLRTCGYGVPNLIKAIEIANNRVNLIIQGELQPYFKEDGRIKTKDMHLYELPWPKDILQEIYDKQVKMKVTLSYFIEPGPGEKGWQDKYRYASTGLRFDLNGSSDKKDFIKRINRAAREEGDGGSIENTINWKLGPNNRDVGSIHSDTWTGLAADLALSNYIGIYPVVGWWKERSHLGKWDQKVRYSLVVSLETPDTEIDLLTSIKNEISARVETQVETEIEF